MSNFQRLDTLPPFVHMTAEDARAGKTTDLLMWSAPFDPPAIGDTIRIRINAIGLAKVTAYASMDGYLGVMAAPIDPPDWWIKQNGKPSPTNDGLCFGAEIALT
ncbi:hypothetical protein H4CHR_02924 [Variovorax sp. PBS-H4]|uniref:hypothetical protein n=1 Tax=Variovorax sp. PBS-H4 TaxID=434008 RepID=UPI0013195596|nr:hypothetical protein [Variovorax sp. PBS-H4]VTU32011.1 hypothetical protein H4CHR_02924 [Variovorax sp. PBS-H4]